MISSTYKVMLIEEVVMNFLEINIMVYKVPFKLLKQEYV
jgi:hypothetical protein